MRYSTEELIKLPQFSLSKKEKEEALLFLLNELHLHHLGSNHIYKSVVDKLYNGVQKIESIGDFPFLPIAMYKNYELKSVKEGDVFKVLTSSGTTGQSPSKIFLDREAASIQTKALSSVISSVIGKERLPMLIVDSMSIYKNPLSYSARGAGVLGLSIFGKDHHYILDDDFQLDEGKVQEFIEKYNGKKVLIFGFTFMIWEYLFEKLEKRMDLSQAILIHSGGWKKLEIKAVDNQVFKNRLFEKFGLDQVYNFYGMIEQIGSVYIENSKGFLQCPNFSDIIIRNPNDFSIQPHGEEGLIQTLSVLPRSYPGHSILTEDIGVCMGEDVLEDSNWKGKYFKILRRAKKAELRGCSDTFQSNFSSR